MLLSIEENITCEVCIEQMLTPYILTCGHTFCQPCLMDWFSTLLATFLQSNPGYDPHPPSARQYIQRARHPRVSAHQRQALQRAIRTLYEDNIKPTLTCPKCREALPSAPIECYALKGIAQSVAKASGKIRGDDAARRAAATRRSEGIWDGFFPQPPKIP
ncbi:hypothetical protein BDW22DRAFT_1326623 [Trametopsis cervina]|nr:hypothetical protein BDW22DRAFT_1326623 [Trametopsis cervina]